MACAPPPEAPLLVDAMPPDAAPGCPPGAPGCPCDVGTCNDGWVCDAETDRCRAPLPCACVQFQRCAEGPGQDAECLPACAPGLDWDPMAERCVADVCHPEAPGSIAAACAADQRVCEPPGRCGDCLPGFAPGPEGCAPVPDCAALDCEAENRGCTDDDGWPRCTACLAGWVEFGGACVPDTCDLNVPGSTAADCAERHRLCVDEAGGATCGACVAGRREVDHDEGVRCTLLRTCADLDCAAEGRLCAPGDPAARTDAACGDCLPGWADRGDGCVPAPAFCDDLNAADPDAPSLRARCAAIGRGCVDDQCGDCLPGWRPSSDGGGCAPVPTCDDCRAANRTCTDERDGARCGDCVEGHRVDAETGACVPDCPAAGQVRHPVTGACVEACDPAVGCGAGEVCRAVTEGGVHVCGPDCGDGLFNGLECVACPPCDRIELGEAGPAPEVTLDGRCICETVPGHYYTLAGEVGPRPCDVDGDGWLARGARVALESVDPVVRARARCDVVAIEAVELGAWSGPTRTVPLDRPVVLYESERNDDPRRLRRALAAEGIDPILVDRGYDAARLNPLTRLCHTARADYDDDGVPDVEAPSGVAPIGAPTTVQALAPFAHFAELHDMALVDRGGRPTLRISEKVRGDIGFAVRFPEMQPDAESRWQTCAARGDSRYDPRTPRPGFDFADIPATADFPGMTHHSLFRCLTVRNAADADALHQVEPLTAADQYALTRHTAAGFEPVLQRPAAGEAMWGVARYQHDLRGLQLARDYRFGCVDECAEHRSDPGRRLPDFAARCGTPPGEVYPACRDLPDRFGQIQCEGVPCNFGADGQPIDDDGDGDVDEFGGLPDSLAGTEGADPDDCLTGGAGACAVGWYVCNGPVAECQALDADDLEEIPCNGVTDDCDDIVDEDPLGQSQTGQVWNGRPVTNGVLVDHDEASDVAPQLGAACTRGLGQCLTRGALRCTRVRGRSVPACRSPDIAGEGPDCPFDRDGYPDGDCLLPLVNDPQDETCNGLDDDCDGVVDEGLRRPAGELACRGRRCSIPGVQSACGQGVFDCRDGQDVCEPVYGGANNPDDLPTLVETCNGINDDCDDAIDEDNVCFVEHRFMTGRLYPRKANGADREFDGNGPDVDVEIALSVVGQRVEMTVDIRMDEPGNGGTLGTVRHIETWNVPDDGTDSTIALAQGMSPNVHLEYTDSDHNEDLIATNNDDAIRDGVTETIPVRHPTRDRPLRVQCLGDRDGVDIADRNGNGGHSYCEVSLWVAVTRQPQPPLQGPTTCGDGICDPGEACDGGDICGRGSCDATCTRRLDVIPPDEDAWCVDREAPGGR